MSSTSLVIWKNFHTHLQSQWPQKPLAPRVAWVHVLLVFPDIFKIDLEDVKRSVLDGVCHPKRWPWNPLGSSFQNKSFLSGLTCCFTWCATNLGHSKCGSSGMVSRNNGLRAFGVRLIPTLSNIFDVSREIHRRMTHIYVVGGFNPFETYYSSQIRSFPQCPR